jgi:hypothetical protein
MFAVTVLSMHVPVLHLSGMIRVDATSSQGARVFYLVTASDPVYSADQIVILCTSLSGALFPIGTTVVPCRAANPAGKVSTEQFRVVVRGALPQLYALLGQVEHVAVAKQGRKHLEHALAQTMSELQAGHPSQACHALSAFEQQVHRLLRHGHPWADDLWRSALRILKVLGCSWHGGKGPDGVYRTLKRPCDISGRQKEADQ